MSLRNQKRGNFPQLEQTRFGFKYGSLYVVRIMGDGKFVCLGIGTKKSQIEIYATPSGNMKIFHGNHLLLNIKKKIKGFNMEEKD